MLSRGFEHDEKPALCWAFHRLHEHEKETDKTLLAFKG